MARKKAYIEEEVIEKAMNLFWLNGYEATSTRMLEKAMGINQFSIYSSFGSKQGLFLESLKCYETKIKHITDKLKASTNGVEGVRQYFYDFIEFSKENEHPKGCMITNAANELGENADPIIQSEIIKFTNIVRDLFLNSLKSDTSKCGLTLEREANFLIISMFGLSIASKVFSPIQITDFIETTFDNL